MKQFENLKLKVCGLTQHTQIQELISLNVSFLGFIFYEKSPRYVLNHLSLKEISEIEHHGKVGVFVNESVANVVAISVGANLNFVQLHGDESESFISELRSMLNEKIKIIKVCRIGIEAGNSKFKIQNSKSEVDYFLFDTDSKFFGGTGNSFNWEILNEVEIPKPYFLSGGISLGNIGQLSIINHRPFSLDINSKFETEPGIKDVEKIKDFIRIMKTKSSHEVTK